MASTDLAATDLATAIAAGTMADAAYPELGEVVAGTVAGRRVMVSAISR